MAAKVWLDTDIGTDVDDAVALTLALLSPEVELVGVSTVYGDVALRSRMVLKMLALGGRSSIPVYSGCERPLLNERPVYWAGHEGVGLLGPEDAGLTPQPGHAVEAILRAAEQYAGELVLVSIGPMTNIGMAFAQRPGLAKQVKLLLIMGGAVRASRTGLALPLAEHNFRSDPEAASIALRSGAPTVVVPLDVTTQVQITADAVSRLKAVGDGLRRALADQLDVYLTRMGRAWTHMHDPLALSHAIRPGLLTLEKCEVQVETRSEIAAGATWVRLSEGAQTQVALGVERVAFEQFLLERLTASG